MQYIKNRTERFDNYFPCKNILSYQQCKDLPNGICKIIGIVFTKQNN